VLHFETAALNGQFQGLEGYAGLAHRVRFWSLCRHHDNLAPDRHFADARAQFGAHPTIKIS
jgi:hypothetical protein